MVDMSVKIGRVTLKNPIMPASGAFSTELAQVMDINRLGALVTKTVSREYRIGNPPPRVAEVEGGMINSIGLPDQGHRVFPRAPASRLQALHAAARRQHHRDDRRGFRGDGARRRRAGCRRHRDEHLLPDARARRRQFRAARGPHLQDRAGACARATDKPLWAKLSPNAGEIDLVAVAAEKAGADALTVSNTLLGLKINIETFRPAIGNGYGGLSGPGIKPIIVRMVHQCSKAVKIPIIGCGGIVKVEDVVEYMLAGASAVDDRLSHLPQSVRA